MMKTIRIALENFWPVFKFSDSLAYKLLSKHYDIQVVTENPDLVFASVFGVPKNYLRHKCPRIMVLGEPMEPDFSVVDYAIGFSQALVPDYDGKNRYFRFPEVFWEWHLRMAQELQQRSTNSPTEILSEKKYFCNFIYSHRSTKGIREEILRALESYKRVECAGSYLNNMPEGFSVSYLNESRTKIEFQRQCKFTIAVESMTYPGFVTEKIVHAFYANTIPIYFGDPFIARTFNKDAFINVNDFATLEDLVAYVKKVDSDDELYLSMLQQPVFPSENYLDVLISDYENFLICIVEQGPEEGIRRPMFFGTKSFEDYLMAVERPKRTFAQRALGYAKRHLLRRRKPTNAK